MAAQQFPSTELIPLTAPESQASTPQPPEPAPTESANLTRATTAGEYEISARWDDSLYVNHWGINE